MCVCVRECLCVLDIDMAQGDFYSNTEILSDSDIYPRKKGKRKLILIESKYG